MPWRQHSRDEATIPPDFVTLPCPRRELPSDRRTRTRPKGATHPPTSPISTTPRQRSSCAAIDTFFALKAFHDAQRLTFPLLSDFNKQVIRAYDVFNEDMIGLHGIAKRAVFVVDSTGVVRHREVLDDARNEPDYQKVYAALEAL